jgi:carboxyl-terminal processing protease
MQSNFLLRTIVLSGMVFLQSLAFAQELPRLAVPDNLPISFDHRLKVFTKAWETINKNYFDPKFNGVDWAQMKEKYRPLAEAATDKVELLAVLNKMMGELRTSHTGASAGFQYGTGIVYFQLDGQWLVRTIPGSPAQLAGIDRGWTPMGSEGDCAAAGKKVTVRLLDLREQIRTFEIPCARYTGEPDSPPSLRKIENGVIYLSFANFLVNTGNWVADQVAKNKSASAMVLDLRGNWGGAAEALQKCINLFFAERTVLGKFRDRKGKELIVKASGSQSAYRGRVFVLIDGRSGSSAEVFAAAIQETGRGIIVGRTSKGGVLGAMHYKLPNSIDLHVPLYDFHTAKGVRLEGRGVIPNEAVTQTAKDFREDRDVDLERVIQLLQLP